MVVREPRTAGVQYSVDCRMLATLSALEEEIAIEMGEWKTKSQIEATSEISIVEILRTRRQRREQAEQAATSSAPETPKELE